MLPYGESLDLLTTCPLPGLARLPGHPTEGTGLSLALCMDSVS